MTHHEHHHEHRHGSQGCSGGCCGGNHGCCSQNTTFTQPERDFLLTLLERQFLPMAQFVVTSTKTHELEMVALSPVHFERPETTMEEAKATADMILHLEELGLLTVDIDESLDDGSYEVYRQSTLFAHLAETVAEGAARGFLGDTATVQQGTIAVTPLCIHRYGA